MGTGRLSNPARRVVVISDLHLGGEAPVMMSRAAELAAFVDALPTRVLRQDEQFELVVAGDFVDFLAVAPFASWTPEPAEAKRKLACVTDTPPFSTVFDALARLVAAGHALTILVGNHDVELALPPVQDALLARLEATPRAVRFVADNRAHRIGGLLIEHGNRYDGANLNDWTGLRAIASALSRGEAPHKKLEVSAGSWIVKEIISPLKRHYPFIDLLQPQGELVALLLVAFEPGLSGELKKIARMLHAQRLQDENREGAQPGETRNVSFHAGDGQDNELDQAFGSDYQTLRAPAEQVSAIDVLRVAWQSWEDSLSQILDRGEPIPAERLLQLRVAMRKMLLADDSDHLEGDAQQYGKAAQRMIEASKGTIEVVVMGHTHYARHHGPPERASYLNTGTWADVIRVPRGVLEDGRDRELQDFLASVRKGEGRTCPATWVDVRVEPDGRVSSAVLRKGIE